MKEYNMALISSPKNQAFYRNEVPLEIFLQDDVHSIRVVYQDRIIYTRNDIADYHFEDTISFAGEGLSDRELVFEFYDDNEQLLKLEAIVILTGDEEVEWPALTIATPLRNLNEGRPAEIQITLENDSPFTLAEEVRYQFATHIGWSRGERKRWAIDRSLNSQTMTDSYVVPDQSPVLGLYAGTEITYGKFVKTIHDEHLIYRGTWADPIRLRNSF